MHRLIDEHYKRKTHALDGAWRFMTDPTGRGEALGFAAALPEDAQSVVVPSVWNALPGLLDYEGAAWYEKKFYTDGGTLRFVFGAVATDAAVYLDGKLLGTHYGGFCEFSFITEAERGEHTLVVRADNSFDADSIPHAKVDWYHYGGIIRSVSFEELSGLCVLACRADYTLSDSLAEAKIVFRLDLYNTADDASSLKIAVGGRTLVDTAVAARRGASTLELPAVTFGDVSLWSPETPVLYALCAETDTDDLFDRVGFRTIEARGGRILLNGKEIELCGVCRHDERPDWGFSVPAMLEAKDVDLLCELGANAVRGSHYPNARVFVDMLDERGLLFESEIPIWGCGYAPADLARSLVLSRGLAMLREMVNVYFNHPSIAFWCVHNEIASDTPEGRAMTELYYTEIKKIGGGRLVTFASNHMMTDVSFAFCDVIFLNRYIGWYGGSMEEWGPALEEFARRREALGLADKPVVMSEFGCAALYGCHDLDTVRWSEEYQARLLSHCLSVFHASPMVKGFFIWQFADMRTAKEMALDRARSFNNKGIVNEHRKPKASFFAVKKLYHQFKEEGGNKA